LIRGWRFLSYTSWGHKQGTGRCSMGILQHTTCLGGVRCQ
jgi:hypothetical protein